MASGEGRLTSIAGLKVKRSWLFALMVMIEGPALLLLAWIGLAPKLPDTWRAPLWMAAELTALGLVILGVHLLPLESGQRVVAAMVALPLMVWLWVITGPALTCWLYLACANG